MKTWGIGYMGSKSKLAEKIVGLMPKRKRLYDVFLGGGSITHCAMARNKFEEYHINDINWMCTQMFINVLNGKCKDEKRWISREEFEET